jgi:hypothetical protein
LKGSRYFVSVSEPVDVAAGVTGCDSVAVAPSGGPAGFRSLQPDKIPTASTTTATLENLKRESPSRIAKVLSEVPVCVYGSKS